jgi:hypothetical protein
MLIAPEIFQFQKPTALWTELSQVRSKPKSEANKAHGKHYFMGNTSCIKAVASPQQKAAHRYQT